MLNRRSFFVSALAAPAAGAFQLKVPAEQQQTGGGFPLSDYTPFGYLDNPFHTWNLHRSGVLRSLPGIGFAFYFPAGPGGYFDYARNGIYEAHLRLGFVIGGRRFWAPQDFEPGQLSSSHHTKNLFSYEFVVDGTRVVSTFALVGEDALAARVTVERKGTQPIRLIAAHQYRLGGAAWWGRDGLAGTYSKDKDSLVVQSFAAGPVFAISAGQPSTAHYVGPGDKDLESRFESASSVDQATSYYPNPLHVALLYDLGSGGSPNTAATVVLARAANISLALQQARAALGQAAREITWKRAEDAAFWRFAPQLEGDWPKPWKHGFVYDFETLRMMVRRPAGVYKHPWDAMQIQAPRNVLAETSIDMWALSYADPDVAKDVFLGQFLDAPADNIPCMREDGQMNMIAADGSECGTSISWCYPYFCAASIWARTRDKRWLAAVYPGMSRLLRWTLAHRTDSGGFVVGKCSWETGMDASRRFLIRQPTGGELTEFVRLVELQSATAQAGEILARFATVLGDNASLKEWQSIQRTYAAKTQELWRADWFYDFDTRSNQAVTNLGRQVAQAAPVFCGVATPDQVQRMVPAMRDFHVNRGSGGELNWSSTVLPYLESLWAGGEMETLSQAVEAIAERIYSSMDRRSLEPAPGAAPSPESRPRRPLGWPGVSCETWGSNGAVGGEGYGWGAVLPAHIIRSLLGFRESNNPDELWICPNLPDSFLAAGKVYRVRNLRYLGDALLLSFKAQDSQKVIVEGAWSGSTETVAVADAAGQNVTLDSSGGAWKFEGLNHHRYQIRLDARRA